MAIKNYSAAAETLIQLSGGKENFITVENCATRVRIQYKDLSKVDKKAIGEMDGVLSVIEKDGLQVVVGPGVCNKLCAAINEILSVDPVLGALIGCITLSGDLTKFGTSAGKGGLIGVIISILVLKYIYKFIQKIIPNQVAVIFVPTLSVLITAALMITTLMPVCGVLSDAIVSGLMWILDKTGVFGGFILAACFPTLISTGLHHGLTAIHMEMLNTLGYAPLISVQVMSNAGMVGAACGIFLLSKNEKVRQACRGAIPTSFLCVGEPVIYGVCLPSGFGFITGSIGAGVGGALIRLFNVSFNAMGMAGMSALPLVADGKYLYYLISYFGGAIAACVLTYIVGKARHYE